MTHTHPSHEIRRHAPDVLLFGSVVALCTLGLVMVYSASSVFAFERFGDSAYFLKRQLLWMVLGLAAMWFTFHIHYTTWRRLTGPALLLALGALGAVLFSSIGTAAGGARRWIALGPLSFQPVEAAKLALVLYLANFLANRQDGVRRFGRGILPPLFFCGLMAALVMRQPDMGSAVILVLVTFVVLFAAGARIPHLAGVALLVAPLAALMALREEYRRERLLAFLNPWQDAQGTGFQIIQSLLAIGSGGLFGVGLGQSRQKFFYLPERHTDFVFAILAEELGLVGAAVLIGLFALFALRAFRTAVRAPDRYGALLGAGIASWVVGQAAINIGVVSGALPVTGVPLPFVSFGGSSLIVLMAAVGICLNLSQYARPSASGQAAAAGGVHRPGRARPVGAE
ncbi:MAG: putative lipid II flippase FtsW [Armatimonadota bacterium]|nr:putative lipid II flippase FtsW [Armatimonadota bacterium]